MPVLREWQVNYPRYWTVDQAKMYLHDATVALALQIRPIGEALGPLQAAAVLLTLVTQLVRDNPVYAHDIQTQMANTYDLVTQVKEAADGTMKGKPN